MEPILACLYGGVIIGVSCGIMLREGATTGGTELAARLLKLKLESLSIGTLCLAIDILVTVTYALIFRDLTRALYGMISLSLISVSIDKVVYGPNAAKVAYIISWRGAWQYGLFCNDLTLSVMLCMTAPPKGEPRAGIQNHPGKGERTCN